jgi:hypothetical protein
MTTARRQRLAAPRNALPSGRKGGRRSRSRILRGLVATDGAKLVAARAIDHKVHYSAESPQTRKRTWLRD